MYMKLSAGTGFNSTFLVVGTVSNITPYSPPSFVNPTPETSPIAAFISIALSIDAAPVIPIEPRTFTPCFIPRDIILIANLIPSFFDGIRATISVLLLSMIFPSTTSTIFANVSIRGDGLNNSI